MREQNVLNIIKMHHYRVCILNTVRLNTLKFQKTTTKIIQNSYSGDFKIFLNIAQITCTSRYSYKKKKLANDVMHNDEE